MRSAACQSQASDDRVICKFLRCLHLRRVIARGSCRVGTAHHCAASRWALPGPCPPFALRWHRPPYPLLAHGLRHRPEIRRFHATPIARASPVHPTTPFPDPSMKTRMRPRVRTARVAMLHGIVVYVLNVSFKVAIVADRVLPETSLPHRPLVALRARGKDLLHPTHPNTQDRTPMSRKPPFRAMLSVLSEADGGQCPPYGDRCVPYGTST